MRETRHILVVDDHTAVRQGLAEALAEEGIGDCSEASGPAEALELAGRQPPDVVLLDLSPATEEAFALIAELCARNIPVLVCSSHEEASYVRRALAAGARGYLTKREAPREVARTVRDLLEGWMLISPRAAEGLR
jgi:two-component system, NarL family, invasion response regulator UvrY